MHLLRNSRWASCAVLAWLIITSAGCELPGSNKPHPNPVAGPPPKRRDDNQISRAKDTDVDEQTADVSDGAISPAVATDTKPAANVKKAAFSKSADPHETIAGGEVAALVNGLPIFVDDVIEGLPPEVGDQLLKIRRQSTPEEYAAGRRAIARQFLPPIVERELLARGLRETMKPDQFKGLLKAVEREFEEKELPKIMQEMGVSSRSELQVKLREQQASIETVRSTFQTEQMARYFIGTKVPPPKKPDRSQLLAYYQEHIKDFETAAKVRWQQIVLKHDKHGGPEKTREFAGELQQKLIDGEDFAALARKHSAGPSAREGGTWDWTRKGSLASKEVETLLFTLPEGGVSPPIIGDKSVELVRVLERKDDYRKPFDQVQDELEKKIQLQDRRDQIGVFIKELRESADIEILLKP